MSILPYELLWFLSLIIAILSVVAFVYLYHRIRIKKKRLLLVEIEICILIFLLIVFLFLGRVTTGHLSMPFYGKAQGPFEYGPELPLLSAAKFFKNMKDFPVVDDIARDPADVPPPVSRNYSEHLTFHLNAREVLGEVTEGTTYNYWTFDDHVPGPLLRARVGDTITISLSNDMKSLHSHSVDFHAVTGPGGGAKHLQVPAGETRSLTFKALNPGLYIYHCASPHSVAVHMAHGQYGLILIEPEEGLPPVDKEFYVVQGEIFTRGRIGSKGLVAFDSKKMLDELPTYVVFNGRVKALNGKMNAEVGETVRIYFGNGGVAKSSAFHVIGEIFDVVYPEAAIGSEPHYNIQSTNVPAGGATIVDFKLEYPADNILVDHHLARMDRGAWGLLTVTGEPNPEIYDPHE